MNSLVLILAVGFGIAVGVAVVYFLIKKNGGTVENEKENQAFLMLQNQLSELRNAVDAKMGESTKIMQHQFGESAKLVRDVTERLTKLDETNRQVISFTDQLQSLQDILKNPKQRGILGEYYLETLLKNVLPPGSYQMQYPFKDSTIVDAVVFVKDKIIPIDSKFSLENYNRLAEEKNSAEREKLERA